MHGKKWEKKLKKSDVKERAYAWRYCMNHFYTNAEKRYCFQVCVYAHTHTHTHTHAHAHAHIHTHTHTHTHANCMNHFYTNAEKR